MNKVFRLIWSATRHCWVVAAEKVSSRGGIPARTVGSLAAVALLAAGNAAFALPTGNSLVAGQATVSTPAAGQMQINQASNRAIINWQSFGIASGETVNINQPNSQAALLNRVVGNSGSEIFGKLTANGQVFLVNPNGVLFGRGAEANVGGLVASSLNITNDDFMNSNLKFFKDGTAGSVTNQGSISAGFAALLGPLVDNNGSIITYKGSTALGAADAVTLNFDTQGLIALKLDQGAYNAQVQNSGIIEADGGRVLLTAKSADDVLKSMVNTSGVIRARTVENKNGEILLLGDMQNGTTTVDGTLDATAPTSGNGGFVETSAAKVQVADSARVTTLAATGLNGTWLIDPDGFTIAASGGDMTGLAVQTALAGGNFSILSTSGSGADGNINVNDAITWNANQLTLTATNDINVNAVMTAGGTASVDFEPGSGNLNMGLSGSGFYGRVDFPGRSGVGFLTIGGQGYTVINSLGAAGSVTGTDLQGMQGNLAGNYALGSDIDATATSGWNAGAGFTPIAYSGGIIYDTYFTGNFNGLGHTVNNLYSVGDKRGLFSAVRGKVDNIGVTNVDIRGNWYVGGLIGFLYYASDLRNSYSTGTVNGTANGAVVGGLVGLSSASNISNSFSNANVTAVYSPGGLIGNFGNWYGTEFISNCFAGGLVTATGGDAGGIAGSTSGYMYNSYFTGSINAPGTVGGIAASIDASKVVNSYYDINNILINGSTGVVRPFGIYNNQFIDYINNNKQLDINSYLNSNNGYYLISTLADIKNILPFVTSNAYKYKLTSGIDLATAPGFYIPNFFSPEFNGSRYIISNLNLNLPGFGGLGLFGTVSVSSIIKDIGVINATLVGGSNVGIIAGANNGTISNSFASGTVNGSDYIGGLVGLNIGSITGSYSSGSVNGSNYVGGLVGYSAPGVVTNSYSGSSVSGTSAVGGLVGANQGGLGDVGTITNSYAYGNVFGTSDVGGLVGYNTDGWATGIITNSYWNNTTSGQATSAGGSGLTTAQMKQQASFSGWDFSTTWRIYEGNSYPLLKSFLTPLTITASNATKTYDGNAYTGGNGVTYSVAGAGASPNLLGALAYSGTSQGAINAGSYVITPTGLYSNQQGYDISFANGVLTVDKAALTVTANNASKTYGQAISFAGTEFTSSGLQNGETIGSVSLASAGAAATANVSGSPYSITASNASGGTFSAGNYTITYQNGSLTISPAALTVTANNANKTYDANAYSGGNGVTYSGFVNSETAAVLGGLLAYGGTSQGAVAVGNYTIIPSGLTAGNYTISYVNGALTISAAVTPPVTPDPTPTPTPAPVVEQQSPLRDHLVSLQAALNMPATSDQQPERHGLLFMPQSGAVQAGAAMEDGPNRLLMVLNGGIKR